MQNENDKSFRRYFSKSFRSFRLNQLINYHYSYNQPLSSGDFRLVKIASIGLDELVPSLKDDIGLVAGVKLVVEAV